ncbi:hypothetical protein CI109_106171 [Kwoniella shandongensis]|uniref:Uncharacterized protein n=1 Tax=Kwoniella shandongensis TaxID=1734106 RepID=A0A5M6BY75_9TREE|nr:uncharacterized protein CI109_003779 [Kwoniella shandongensis]KAA5527808.1 hypothetical protein CI109_003779 [Kwoniella shandongensis]
MSATFDRRRIPAPEHSTPPFYEPLENENENQAGPSRRTDRGALEARPIFLKTGLISQANGSGYIESGGVKIACSVYGPRPKAPPYTPHGSLNVEVKFAPFASDPRRAPLRDTEPLPLSALLTQSLLPTIHLHQYPKSSIDIYLVVLESDVLSNVLSAGLTVASAAIADAGIQMTGLGVGVGGVYTSQEGEGGKTLLDPSKEEEKGAEGTIVLGSMPALGKVTNLFLTGEMDVDQACDMIEKAITASKETHTILAQALIEGAEERGLGATAVA